MTARLMFLGAFSVGRRALRRFSQFQLWSVAWILRADRAKSPANGV